MASVTAQEQQQVEHCNEVRLVGRVSAPATELVLPSGDTLVTWRLVVTRDRPPPRARVPREPDAGASPRIPTIDTLDCQAWSAKTRRTALSWSGGDVVEVQGALRRRFYRTGGAAASRCEVEARSVRRVRRADRRD